MIDCQINLTYKRSAFYLAVLAFVILFGGLLWREIESGDETRVAGIAAEMFINGDWLVPRLNGMPFLEYPPLYYWCTALAYAVFGVTDFAAKFFSAFAAWGNVMLIFLFARKLKISAAGAFIAGFLLLSSAQFFSESRTCRVDMMLAFFVQLAVFGFYVWHMERKIFYWFLLVIGLAGGAYTKGFIGFALPGCVIGAWLAGGDILLRKISMRGYIAALTGAAAALAIVAIWYGMLWKYGGQTMFDTAFWTNNIGRFSGSQGDHAGEWFYYLTKLPMLFLPWLPLLPFAIFAAGREVWKNKNMSLLLLLLFLAGPFFLLNLASGKRVVYLLPLYASCALLCAWYLDNLPETVRLRYEWLIGKIHFSPVKTGVCIVLLTAVVLVAVDLGTALVMNRRKSLRPFFARCSEMERQGRKLVLINGMERTQGAAFFYLHHRIAEKTSEEAVRSAGEIWIIRSKNKNISSRKYADYHCLIGE